MKKKPVTPLQTAETKVPSWPASGPLNPSRRAFLRRVGLGAGGAGFLATVGLPGLSHGQSREVDFSLLEAHPARHDLNPAPPPTAAPAQPMALAPPAPAPPAAAPPADSAASAPEEEVGTVENRALWVEPGYLVLLRWQRPADNEEVIAALEGSSDAVATYLSEQVENSQSLHDLGRLHVIEDGLAALLELRVAPADIQTLHLDHDCVSVCSTLPDHFPDDFIPLPGIAPPTDWE